MSVFIVGVPLDVIVVTLFVIVLFVSVAVALFFVASLVLSTFDNHTSVFVTLCGFPLVSCEWSYAVFPLSHLYAVEEVSPRANEEDISVYEAQFHL